MCSGISIKDGRSARDKADRRQIQSFWCLNEVSDGSARETAMPNQSMCAQFKQQVCAGVEDVYRAAQQGILVCPMKFSLLCDFCSCVFDQKHLKLLTLSFLCSWIIWQNTWDRNEASSASVNKLCYCLVRKVLPSTIAEQRWLRKTSCLLLFLPTQNQWLLSLGSLWQGGEPKWQIQVYPEIPHWGVAMLSCVTASWADFDQ